VTDEKTPEMFPLEYSSPAPYGAIAALNELLRDELSAMGIYQIALRRLPSGNGDLSILNSLIGDHALNARILGREVGELGGVASSDFSTWGTAVRAFETAAVDRDRVLALRAGEAHGLEMYRQALDNLDLPTSTRALILRQLVPKQQRHLVALDAMIQRLAPNT
jgi:hypothetical protein